VAVGDVRSLRGPFFAGEGSLISVLALWPALVTAVALLLLGLGLMLWASLVEQRVGAPSVAHNGTSHRGLSSLPVVAQGVVSGALGADTRAYRVTSSGGVLGALNPAQRLRTRFGRSGVLIGSGGARLGLSLQGVGYGSSLEELGEIAPRVQSNRVVYARGGLSEWYANGPLGLEQGFMIAHAPAGAATGPLTLSIALSGNVHPSLAADGRSISFSEAGGALLRYGGLVVSDARGRTLPGWFALQGGRLLVRADTRGARYPLLVDPFVQQGRALSGSEEKGGLVALGWSVALSSDGNTALIGGPFDNGVKLMGAAWVFTRSQGKWSQQGPKLTGKEESSEGRFGWSVALSSDGNTALIGGITDDKAGAVWVFTRSEGKWSQQGPKLTGGREPSTELRFGQSVALSSDGNTALIGGIGDNKTAGAAWVLTRSEGKWGQELKLTAEKEEVGHGGFGESVALSSDGNTALIGGPFDNSGAGAAWVFTRSEGKWNQQGSKLTGSKEESGSGEFGSSVRLSSDGNTGLIGARFDNIRAGAAWVFTRSEGTWSQQGPKLVGGKVPFSKEDKFGESVALSSDGNTALISSPSEGSGAAWVFTRTEGKWASQIKLTGGKEQTGGGFGSSVALSSDGNTALVGDTVTNSDLGGAWVFVNGTETSLTTSLSTEEQKGEKVESNEEFAVSDTATLSGTNATKATGTVKYAVYSDKECKTLVAKAGEVSVTGGVVPSSSAEVVSAGTYYWQATYSGDASNQSSTSVCGTEISIIKASASLTTSLLGEGQSGSQIEILEGVAVNDTATLNSVYASIATGTVTYNIYADSECKELVAKAGEVSVTNGNVPASGQEKLKVGTYYWQTVYSGDINDEGSTAACGEEIETVTTATLLATSLSGGGHSGGTISVVQGTGIIDQAKLNGTNAAKATGNLEYAVYSDSGCKELVGTGDEVTITNGNIPASNQVKLAPGTYYWQASYSGDEANHQATTACGDEIAEVRATTSLATSLSSGGRSHEAISALEGVGITDDASLGGSDAAKATGTVKYAVYSDKECKTLAAKAGEVTVTNGVVPASAQEKLKAGTYYWQASYSGDVHHESSTSSCGEETEIVGPTPPTVEQVNFTNNLPVILDDQHNTTQEKAETIEEFTGHNNVEWEYSPTTGEQIKSWPIAYPQGTTPQAKVRFELPVAAKQMILEKQLIGKPNITGETLLDGKPIKFTKEFANTGELENQVARHGSYIEIGESPSEPPISANAPLPAEVNYESMQIKWTWTVQVRSEASPTTQSLGSSTLNLFLTSAEPSPAPCKTLAEAQGASGGEETIEANQCTPIYFTLLYAAVVPVALPAPTELQTIEKIWGGFTQPGTLPESLRLPINRKKPMKVPILRRTKYTAERGDFEPGTIFKYYENVNPGATADKNVNREACNTLEDMMATGKGRCGAWATLMVATLNVDKVFSGRLIHLVVNFGATAAGECNEMEPFVCTMLIPKWKFLGGNNRTGVLKFPIRADSIQDEPGVPGQANENPPPYFWDHAIVKAGMGKSAALYDPSYGTGPFPTAKELQEIGENKRAQPNQEGVLKQYQGASVTAYCKPVVGKRLPDACVKVTNALDLGAVIEEPIRSGKFKVRKMWWP
jgi:hypothetical protein